MLKQAARLEEISGFEDDVDLKAPLEPMEHVYFGELKKIRSLVAASASYRLCRYATPLSLIVVQN